MRKPNLNLITLALFLLLVLSGCKVQGQASVEGQTTAAPTTSGAIAMRYPEWQTLCVGRYLIDVPAGTTLETDCKIQNNRFIRLNKSEKEVSNEIQKKIAELKGLRHQSGGSMFIDTIKLSNGGIIIRAWASERLDDMGTLYIYTAVKTPQEVRLYYMEVEYGLDREQRVIPRYVDIATKLRYVPPGTIPSEPGVMIAEDLMLLDTQGYRGESCLLLFTLPDAHGMTLALDTWTVPINNNPLDANDLKMRYIQLESDDPEILRNGKHHVGPLKGYEICVVGKDPLLRFRRLNYIWAAPGKAHDYNNPSLQLLMIYGDELSSQQRNSGPRPFASDQESLAVWDKIVNSIRMRPVTQ